MQLGQCKVSFETIVLLHSIQNGRLDGPILVATTEKSLKIDEDFDLSGLVE